MSNQYIVSARKYRPATFRTVVGQQHLTDTLKGAIASDRLAHAYLFCGPRGVGKTSCARIFARTINCLNPGPDGEACGKCESCLSIDRGNSFNLVELDAASNNKVEDIRAIIDQVAVPPQVGKYRVFIIDEVHMLTSQAFNAFLKTLEEPPSYAIFILATTEKHKVIPTILSRCQIFDFKRITINDIVDHLAYVAESEGITADRRALGVVARKADGAMRDALSIFDQVATSTSGNMTYEAVVENLNVLDYEYFFKLIDAFAAANVPESLLLYKDVRDRGFDSLFFVNSLAQHVRDLMVAADPRTLPLLEVPEDVAKRLTEQSRRLSPKWYYAAMKLLNDCDLNYRTATNKQLLVELTLIRLAQLINPADNPFDTSDRPALRNPSEPLRATTTSTSAPAPAPTPTHPAPTQPIAPTPSIAPAPSAAPTQPMAPMPSAAPAMRGPRPRTFNLNAQATATAAHIEHRREQFSDEQFVDAWNAYILASPEQQILINAMKADRPKRGENLEFTFMVDHPAQIQSFEHEKSRLLTFLRDRVKNDYVTVKAVLNPEKEVTKLLNPADFLKKIGTDNPRLAQFLSNMQIEL